MKFISKFQLKLPLAWQGCVATRVRSRAQSRIRFWVGVEVKTQVRRPGKTKRGRQGDFFASGLIRVEGGDLKES
jgi:hypothetical protein